MNRIVKIVAVVALCVAAATYAAEGGRARRGGAGGAGGRGFTGGMFGARGGMSKMALLRSDQIKKELKITEEQTTKITELATASREESRGLSSGMGNFRDMSTEERAKARAEMTKKRDVLNKKTEKKLETVLLKPQVARLNQIVLQQQGSAGLTSDYVKKGLKLTADQVKKIQAVFKARDEAQQKMFAELRGAGRGADRSGMEGMREKMTALRKKADGAAMAILTKEQTAGLEKLKGTKIEIDRSSLRRGTRGGGGEGRQPRRPRGDGEAKKGDADA